jgi:predicted extracellular nuclease
LTLTSVADMLANMLARLGRASTLGLAASAAAVQAVSISEIQGPAWISPYAGQTVHNVTGVVVAKASAHEAAWAGCMLTVCRTQGPSGVWIQSAPSNDTRASSGLYVYGSSVVNKTAVRRPFRPTPFSC